MENSQEKPPPRCPTCDGAMLTRPVPRCVRCGEPNAAQGVTITTLADLIAAGASFHVQPRDRERRWSTSEIAIRVRGVNDPQCKLYVGAAGVYLGVERKYGGINKYDSELILNIDPRRPITDVDYWKQAKRSIFALVPGRSHVTSLLWDRVKEYRMHAQAKSWDEVLPKEIVEWAGEELAKASSDDSCVDNYRVACTRNSSQMRRYKKQRAGGCCGSHDFTRVGPDGQKYVLGFNYGH